jgi:hypothetical protein
VFVGSYDADNNLLYQTTQYITDTNFKVDYDIKYFIGHNEVFTNAVVNRCLENIYNLQVSVLKILSPVIVYSSTSLNAPVVLV